MLDLDTVDAVNLYRKAMTAVMDLVDGQDPLSKIEPDTFGVLLHVLYDVHERALPIRTRPRACNDGPE